MLRNASRSDCKASKNDISSSVLLHYWSCFYPPRSSGITWKATQDAEEWFVDFLCLISYLVRRCTYLHTRVHWSASLEWKQWKHMIYTKRSLGLVCGRIVRHDLSQASRMWFYSSPSLEMFSSASLLLGVVRLIQPSRIRKSDSKTTTTTLDI